MLYVYDYSKKETYELLKGIKDEYTSKALVINDRKKAILYALKHSYKGDCILIAGKGHEDYQVLKGETIHFDDKKIAGLALKKRLKID